MAVSVHMALCNDTSGQNVLPRTGTNAPTPKLDELGPYLAEVSLDWSGVSPPRSNLVNLGSHLRQGFGGVIGFLIALS